MSEHKGLGLSIEFANVTQGMLAQFDTALLSLSTPIADTVYAGVVVREAARAGWLKVPALSADNVDNLDPRAVLWYSQLIRAHRKELTAIPPE